MSEKYSDHGAMVHSNSPMSDVDRSQLLEICPVELVEPIKALPDELIGIEPQVLMKRIVNAVTNGRRASVRKSVDILRHTFWLEYDAAYDRRRRMNFYNLCRGAVTKYTLLGQLKDDQMKLAYIIIAPRNYQAQILSLLDKASSKLSEILEIPLYDQICRCRLYCRCKKLPECMCFQGCVCPKNVDSKLVASIVKIYEMLEMRAKGALLQKVSIDKRHLIAQIHQESDGLLSNVEAEVKRLSTEKSVASISDIDEQIRLLEGGSQIAVLKNDTAKTYTVGKDVAQVIREEVNGEDVLPTNGDE